MGSQPIVDPGVVLPGRYEVQRLLGEGDRKRTYLARDTKMARQVALSVVKPEALAADPDGTEREAKVLGRIGSHDNVVSLYDYEINAGGSAEYMVFEYLSGGTLAEYLRRTGPLPLGELLRLGRQLSRGLAHLHGRGLVHRDVSPDNVWLDERLVAHLGDFDSAITVSDGDEMRPITTGAFASPEEHDGWSLDARSDLYSLGGVLYVAASGSARPGPASQLRSLRPDLPSAFTDLVTSMLSDSPSDRPDDAGEVLHRLDEARHASNLGALIAAGESDAVEFKSSLLHPYGPLPADLAKKVELGRLTAGQAVREVQKGLRLGVTKTVAAFLNSAGGTLLIGVSDAGEVLGIEADFPYLNDKQHADGWMLSLREVITTTLGAGVWSSMNVSLTGGHEGTVAVIHCPARASETWHREDGGEHFYIRASNATQQLHGSELIRYIREHWAA
jgi:hypothetical protein